MKASEVALVGVISAYTQIGDVDTSDLIAVHVDRDITGMSSSNILNSLKSLFEFFVLVVLVIYLSTKLAVQMSA